MNEVNVLKT